MRTPREVLIEATTIRRRVAELAGAIARDTPDGTVLHVLALLDGAFVFCADLLRELRLPVRTGLMRVVSPTRGGDPACATLPEDFDVRGADLLLVEDILDTGRTLAAMRERLMKLGPSRLRIAVLLDKPARREIGVHPDYVGFEIPDRWVVGYGLDADGLYRNLPHIAWVESGE